MKKLTRVFLIILASVLMTACLAVSVSAKAKIEDLQKSVIYIETTFLYSSRNWGFEGSMTGSGTGFALGKPGEPVKYIGTAAHVVRDTNGTYALLALTDTGEVIDIVKVPDTTPFTDSIDDAEVTYYNGYECYIIIDYVEVTTPVKKAYFSYANNDYRTISIIDIDEGTDVAICELSGDATDRIKAFPLQFKDELEVGDEIVSIGFPGISMNADAEMTLESKNSTAAPGFIKAIPSTTNRKESDRKYSVIEMSGDMSQGMSGGPVFDLETGAIIGINSFLWADASSAVNTKYATCIDYLKPLLDANNIAYVENSAFSGWIMIVLVAAAAVIAVVVILLAVNKKKSAAQGVTVQSNIPAPFVPAAPVSPAPAASGSKYYLLGISGTLAGKKFSITNNAVIGRDPSKCNVVFPENQPGVSGRHCEISVINGALVIKDLGSSYGTFLENGDKLPANTPVTLKSGNRFWVASNENTFEVKY